MPTYKVEFEIEARIEDILHDLGALGGIKNVKIEERKAPGPFGTGAIHRGGYVQGGAMPPPANGYAYTKDEVSKIGGEALGRFNRGVTTYPPRTEPTVPEPSYRPLPVVN